MVGSVLGIIVAPIIASAYSLSEGRGLHAAPTLVVPPHPPLRVAARLLHKDLASSR
jgi:hypothetical protein